MKKRFKRVYVEITNQCNRHCSFCSPLLRFPGKISISQFEHILKELKPFTDYLYLHVKGEPLLHSEFDSILTLCDKYAYKVNITTNGTLLKQRLSILLKHPSLRQINVSLHHFNTLKDQHYLSNILESTTEILNHTPIYVNYRFWTLQNNELTKDMKKMLEQIISYFELDSSLLKNISVSKTQTLKPHLFLSKGDLFDWPSLSLPVASTEGTCHGTKDHIGILCDGTVVPCCLDGNGCINLGNIYKTSLKEIIESPRFQSIYHGFRQNQVTEELCQKCSYRTRFNKE